jgi:hypothetical protein
MSSGAFPTMANPALRSQESPAVTWTGPPGAAGIGLLLGAGGRGSAFGCCFRLSQREIRAG